MKRLLQMIEGLFLQCEIIKMPTDPSQLMGEVLLLVNGALKMQIYHILCCFADTQL